MAAHAGGRVLGEVARMMPLRSTVVSILAGASLALPGANGFSLWPRSWGDVIVATDTTKEGRKIEPPSPNRPVYYTGHSLGPRLGSISGDDLPDVREMNRLVAKVLAKQGYLGAKPGVHEPTLFLVLQWGYLTPSSGDLVWFLGYDANKDIGAPAIPGMLGPEVWRRGFRSRIVEAILDGAGTPNYGIVVTAFDYKSASTTKPIIYWQTRIALPATGKSMAEALPAMMLAAGPVIGRESDTPALIDVDNAREVRIELGELQYRGVVGEAEKDEN